MTGSGPRFITVKTANLKTGCYHPSFAKKQKEGSRENSLERRWSIRSFQNGYLVHV